MNNIYNNIWNKLVVFSFLILVSTTSYGHSIDYVTGIDRLGHLIGTNLEVEDPLRADPIGTTPNINYTVDRKVHVALVYGREDLSDVVGNYWWYRVHFDLFENGSTTAYASGMIELSHESSGGVYEALKEYATTTGNVNLVITQIEASNDAWNTSSPIATGIVPEDVRLELRMEVERFDYLDPTATTSLHHLDQITAEHELEIHWRHIKGAEYYELEWVYIDEEIVNAPSVADRFENAARVEVCGNEYKILTIYPAGELYYRVRPVGRYIRETGSNFSHLKYGAWTELTTAISLPGFELGMNWNVATHFSEGGKYKKNVNFYDEGLRNRQAQTNFSSDEQTIVSTNHYDVEGRPTVNVLPVPSLGNDDLFYKPKFSQNGSGDGYHRNDFDKKTAINGLNNSSGAGYYYSAAHATDNNAEDLYKNYLPDAEGFPLRQTKYMNDNLSRPLANSGLGAFYQIGTNRETKYFYDDASSTQLRRLFGKNIGLAKYYKRHLVQDANGQLQVSYIDGFDKIIATAIAGQAPSNVDEIPGAAAATSMLTESLMDNNVVSSGEGTSIVTSTVFNESAGGVANFNYSLNGKNEEFTSAEGTFCISCDYELTITMQDPCGEPVNMNFGGTFTEKYQTTYSGSDICPSVSPTYPATTPNLTFSVTMYQVGPYIVRKELRVIEKDIEDWVTILETEGMLPDSSTFVDQYISLLDTASCNITCQQTFQQPCYIQGVQQGLTGTALDDFIADCVNMECDAIILTALDSAAMQECESLLNQMQSQVDPDGCMNVDHGITVVTNHPEYCRYEFCDNTYDSRFFDFQLALTTSYADAVAKGLAASGYSSTQYGEAIRQVDPLFTTGSVILSPPYNFNNLPGDMQNGLANYLPDCAGNGGGPDLSLGTFVNCQFAGGTPEMRWQRLVGLYKGLKGQLVYEETEDYFSNTCPSISTDCSIAQENELYDVDTEEEGNDFIDQNMSDLCADVCVGQVESWLEDIASLCSNLSAAELTTISGHLSTYCSGSCGFGNPLGVLLTEDLSNNTSLQAVQTILDANSCASGIMTEISIEFDSTYTIVLDSQGNPVTTESCDIQPCFLEIVLAIQEMYANTQCVSGILGPYNHSNPNCITGVGTTSPNIVNHINVFGSTGNHLLADDLHYFSLDIATGNWVYPPFNTCDVDEWINPRMDLTVTGVGQYTGVLVDVLLNTGATATLALADGPNMYIDCVTTTVVTPISDTLVVSIDSVWQDCINELITEAVIEGTQAWQDSIDVLITEVINEQDCLNGHEEHFSVTYQTTEHHYTLFYYDQGGNLVQTVPPSGAKPFLPTDANYSTYFTSDGEWTGMDVEPPHEMKTQYAYRSTGQILWETMPDWVDANGDQGVMTYYFDYANRVRLTQNSKQAEEGNGNRYGYTKYDEHSRTVESGEIDNYTTISDLDLDNLNFPTTGAGYTLSEQTFTEYDFSDPDNFTQSNLRGRVATVSNDDINTYYSYDAHGNVKAVYHDIISLGEKLIEYEYDLMSGNVKSLSYQTGKVDQFHHEYEYDADNRLTRVYTSEDGLLWERDARYFYYAHGPIARVEIGHDNVQGMDYYYTIQGWRKGVNQSGPNSHGYEMGQDGNIGNVNGFMGRDEYAYALAYYGGNNGGVYETDYKAIGSVNLGGAEKTIWDNLGIETGTTNFPISGGGFNAYNGLFNGNIAMMVTDLKHFNAGNMEGLQAMTYKYDQLNRIKRARARGAIAGAGSGNVTWQIGFSAAHNYDSDYTYDANGNMVTLDRNAHLGAMDNFMYHYKSSNQGPTNQLDYVEEGGSTDPIRYDVDIDDQITNNYSYDALGNLDKDDSEEISEINWTVYGKVSEVNYTTQGISNGRKNMRYKYDPGGNRLYKQKFDLAANATTFYVRDENGNTLAIYEKDLSASSTVGATQVESPIYGVERIGYRKFSNRTDIGVGEAPIATADTYERIRGERHYELSNHLGNVLVATTDQKIGQEEGTADLVADFYAANVVSANDYYPFGMNMPNRVHNSAQYRYGFAGKEKEPELTGNNDSHIDFGERIYDTRVGRWLSVDPQWKKLPGHSPYNYALNNPVAYSDPDGELPWIKWLVDIGAGMATDYFLQVTANLIINDMSLGDALTEVSVWQIVRSGGENLIKNKHYAAIASGAGDAIEYLSTADDPSLEGAMQRFLLGAGASYMGDWFAKYGIEKVAKGLKKLGIDSETIYRLTRELACFAEGTLVNTENGLIPIEDIKVGDKVWSFNEKTGEEELKEVVETLQREITEIVTIAIGDKTIETTKEHPFYVNGAWRPAHTLKVGELLTVQGTCEQQKIKSIEISENPQVVYNFEVFDNHSYYVSEFKVLVHNKCVYEKWEEAIDAGIGSKLFKSWKKASRSKIRRNLINDMVNNGSTRDAAKAAAKDNFAHHLVPLDVLVKNPVLKQASKEGFDINSSLNGILLNAKVHDGNHPGWTQYVNEYIEKNYKNYKGSAKDFVEKKLVPHLKRKANKAKKANIGLDSVVGKAGRA